MLVQFLFYNSSTISVGRRHGNAGNTSYSYQKHEFRTRIETYDTWCKNLFTLVHCVSNFLPKW